MLEIIVLDATHAAVVVRSDAIVIRPTIPIFQPLAGIGFGGGWDLLTWCHRQLIFEAVGFITEHTILLLHLGHSSLETMSIMLLARSEYLVPLFVEAMAMLSRYPSTVYII